VVCTINVHIVCLVQSVVHDAARANVKRERERNVTHLFAGQSDHS
jgi:hypothetical protein